MRRALIVAAACFPHLAYAGYDDSGIIFNILLHIFLFIALLLVIPIICPPGQKILGLVITIVFYPILLLMLEVADIQRWSHRVLILWATWLVLALLNRYVLSRHISKPTDNH